MAATVLKDIEAEMDEVAELELHLRCYFFQVFTLLDLGNHDLHYVVLQPAVVVVAIRPTRKARRRVRQLVHEVLEQAGGALVGDPELAR